MATSQQAEASPRITPRQEGREGTISLIIGPMFSEKTTEMVSRVRRAAYAREAGIIIKWRGDTRYEKGDVIAAHSEIRQSSTDCLTRAAPIRVVSADALNTVGVVDEKIIGIDEGQFFPDLIEACTRWASEGRSVIVAALDGDFRRRPFGQVCDMVPLCESVEKRKGVCMVCQSNGSSFTKRTDDTTELVSVGGAEKYVSVCRTCYEYKMD